MDVYLVRHGEAVSERVDLERPLSAVGRDEVARVAVKALAKQVRPLMIYHSGIVRARQTAEILSEKLRPDGAVQFMDGLQPLDDPAAAAAELAVAQAPIMLVGHLPFMNRLAALLVNGDPERPVVDFAPATLLCLANETGRWSLRWILAP